MVEEINNTEELNNEASSQEETEGVETTETHTDSDAVASTQQEELEQTGDAALDVGDIKQGVVTKIEDKHALVDVGYKIDGVVPISELSSLHIDNVSDVLSEGDELELKVIKVSEDELVLSKKALLADRAWVELESKYQSGDIFEVTIAAVVKGGLVVDLGVRGFIPASLVERHYVDDFAEYQDQNITVKIVEMDQENNKLILSHRAVLDEEAYREKQQTLADIEQGSTVKGTVQRLTDFGVFVDIGGVDGLVHISQLAHYRVEHPSDIVAEGQEVDVKVLSVDKENERISLSIKETQPGPWEGITDKITAGDVVDGTVKRLVSFGAFVEVLPGVEGLVHISEISNQHIGTPQEVLTEEEDVKVKVLDVNADEQRISLSLKELEESHNYQEDLPAEDEDDNGFSLGDMIGDKLNDYK